MYLPWIGDLRLCHLPKFSKFVYAVRGVTKCHHASKHQKMAVFAFDVYVTYQSFQSVYAVRCQQNVIIHPKSEKLAVVILSAVIIAN